MGRLQDLARIKRMKVGIGAPQAVRRRIEYLRKPSNSGSAPVVTRQFAKSIVHPFHRLDKRTQTLLIEHSQSPITSHQPALDGVEGSAFNSSLPHLIQLPRRL